MIIPYGKNLLVQIIEKPKKNELVITISEELDPIVKCKILEVGSEVGTIFYNPECLYFRRYDLRDCIDKEKKIYIVKSDCLLCYEENLEEEDGLDTA